LLPNGHRAILAHGVEDAVTYSKAPKMAVWISNFADNDSGLFGFLADSAWHDIYCRMHRFNGHGYR
jgi:hypothetical protein